MFSPSQWTPRNKKPPWDIREGRRKGEQTISSSLIVKLAGDGDRVGDIICIHRNITGHDFHCGITISCFAPDPPLAQKAGSRCRSVGKELELSLTQRNFSPSCLIFSRLSCICSKHHQTQRLNLELYSPSSFLFLFLLREQLIVADLPLEFGSFRPFNWLPLSLSHSLSQSVFL